MTRNSDRIQRAERRLEALYDALDPQLDRAVEALQRIDLTEAGALDIQRFVRAVELTAKAGRGVAALARAMEGGGRGAAAGAEEDMADDDFDDSPDGLERVRDELGRRLDDLDGRFEHKGLAFQPGSWPVARPVEQPAMGTAGPPDSGE
jgi:hypothetical protein